MSNLTKHQFKGIYGVTDLWAEYPYYSEWGTFYGHWDITEEEYAKDPEDYTRRIRSHNKQYISELKASGKYGTEFISDINLKYNPMFDAPKSSLPDKRMLDSYRLVFLDSGEFDGQPNIKTTP
jgi:hypothetical protein